MAEKTKTIEKIVVPYGTVKRIAAHFGCTSQTVRLALNFSSPGSRSQQEIRREAIRNYGGVKIERPLPSYITD